MNQTMNNLGHHFTEVAQTIPKYFLRDANHIVELCDDSYHDSEKVIRELFQRLNPSASFDSGLEQINDHTQLVFINNALTSDKEGLDLLHAVDAASSANVELILCVRNIHYWKHIDSFANQQVATSMTNAMNYKAMVQLIESSNFTMLPVIGQRDQSAEFQQFCTKITSFLAQEDGRKRNEMLSLSAVPYFIVRLVKKQHTIKPIMLQSLTLKPKGAVNDIRIDFPFDALSTIPGVETRINHTSIELLPKKDKHHKIMVWHRPLLDYSDAQKIRTLVNNGYLVIVDWDDWIDRWPEIEERGHINFKLFHAISTSKPELAEALKPFNPNIKVFQNSLYALPVYQKPLQKEMFSIFFGAIGREDEVEDLKQPIQKLIDTYGNHVHFEVVNTRNLFDWLPTKQKRFTPLCNYTTYNTILANCDFCLLPLSDNTFNRMKSDLKFIEAASNSTIAIASPVVYESTIKHQETGFIYRDTSEIVSYISHCIDNKDFAASLAQNAYDYVKQERMLSSHFRKRYNWYLELLDRLPELNKELLERCPQLQNDYS